MEDALEHAAGYGPVDIGRSEFGEACFPQASFDDMAAVGPDDPRRIPVRSSNLRLQPPRTAHFDLRGPAAYPPDLFEVGQRRSLVVRSSFKLGRSSVNDCWLTDDVFPTWFARHEWWGLLDDETPESPPAGYSSVWIVLDRKGTWWWWRHETRFGEGARPYLWDWEPVPEGPEGVASELCPEICGGDTGVRAITRPDYASKVSAALEGDGQRRLASLFKPR